MSWNLKMSWNVLEIILSNAFHKCLKSWKMSWNVLGMSWNLKMSWKIANKNPQPCRILKIFGGNNIPEPCFIGVEGKRG